MFVTTGDPHTDEPGHAREWPTVLCLMVNHSRRRVDWCCYPIGACSQKRKKFAVAPRLRLVVITRGSNIVLDLAFWLGTVNRSDC